VQFPLLYVAGKWSTVEVVLLLLRSGCHHSDTTSLGVTALHMAAQEGRPAVAATLLSAGARGEARDFAGWTALHYCANHRWATWDPGAPLDGHVGVVHLLTSGPLPGPYYAALASATDDDGATAMHSAAQSGRVEMCKALHQAGVPFQGPPRTCTPFHVAASHGRCAVLEQFLTWACPVHRRQLLTSRCDRGDTPALAAAMHGRADVVLLLADRGGAWALTSSRLLPAAVAQRPCPSTIAALLGLGLRKNVSLAVTIARLKRRWAVAHSKSGAAGNSNIQWPVEEAARYAQQATACEAVLMQAWRGTPLVWTQDNARLYPELLKQRTREMLRALHRCTVLRELPVVLRDNILERVFVWEARMACWPSMLSQQWDIVHKAQGIARRTGIKAESVPPMPEDVNAPGVSERDGEGDSDEDSGVLDSATEAELMALMQQHVQWESTSADGEFEEDE